MKYYELTYLVSPETSEEELKSLQEKLNSIVQAEGGILGNSQSRGKKELTFRIKKKNDALLASLDFYLKPEKIEDLKKKVIPEDKILRFLILTKKQVKKPKILRPRRRKEKVELEDIEKKLKEILDESQ